jgi:hypothetical protein
MDSIQSDIIYQYKECLRLLKRGECWCDMNGTAMTIGHSKGCLFAQRLMMLEKQKDEHGKE